MTEALRIHNDHRALARLFASDALIGPPMSEELVELMSIMFSAEEARVALAVKPFRQQPARKVARRVGAPDAEVEALLRAMAGRKVIHHGRKGYCLLPLIPGVFEKFLMGGDESPYHREVSRRIRAFFSAGYMKDHVGSPTQVLRTIPIDRGVDVSQTVIDEELFSAIVAAHDRLAILNNCQCRQAAHLEGEPCKRAPATEGCLAFGSFATFFVNEGGARYVTAEEMTEAVRERWEHQLILFGANVSPESPNLLCACCDCCCQMLEGLILPDPRIVVTAPAFLVAVDETRCTSCGKCVKACNTDAHRLEAKQHRLDLDKCVGCGLCLTVCPEGVIRTVKNDRHRPPASTYGRLALRLVPAKTASVLLNKARRSESLGPLFAFGEAAARGVSPWMERLKEASQRIRGER